MHHLYVPCGQQHNRHETSPQQQQPRSFRSSFRRSSSQFVKKAEFNTRRPRVSSNLSDSTKSDCQEQRSSASPPSLGSSSPSSLEDGTSPKTPTLHNGGQSTSAQYIRENVTGPKDAAIELIGKWQNVTSHGITTGVTDKIPTTQVLPCRSKQVDEQISRTTIPSDQAHDVAPPVVYETVVRSRLARTSTEDAKCLQELYTSCRNPPAAVATFNSRCHARRRPCTESRAVAPPKLRRDTECTDSIVRLIVCLSTKLVHAIWSQSTTTPKTTSTFNDAGVLPLRVFIQETLRRSKTSYSTLQIALYYLIQLKPHVQSQHSTPEQGLPICRALQCGRRMFLTALILASKYLQDRNYSSRAWSKISGLPIAEINENERRYLNLIQFNLHMKKETFENWSKITLTLCKVGETSMTNAAPFQSDLAKTGSDAWWTFQLRRLTSELVQDTRQTDEYLASLTANTEANVISSEQMAASLDTPPSSPDDSGDPVTEKNLMSMLADAGSDSSVNRKVIDLTSSPASVTSLPSRPSLPNLPTPSTTPRYNNVLPWPKGSCRYSTRCSASSQALLNLDKQAMNVANLDTCPPPKPRPCDLARSTTFPTKRVPSNLSSSLATSSLTCSPESAMSDTSSGTTRSRSSSISSTSSLWFASGRHNILDETTGTCSNTIRVDNETKLADVPAPYGFYHSVDRAPHGPPFGNLRPARFLDEGYGSDDRSEVDKFMFEKTMAQSLTSMVADASCVSRPAESAPQQSPVNLEQFPSRRNKRTHSSTTENTLHHNIRHLVWSEQPDIEILDAPLSACQDGSTDKQVQCPEKRWADFKKPVTTTLYNKRIALQYTSETVCNTAPEAAARYLRDVPLVGS